ncbi:50S ribosome-binding GTPase [Candidatus Pacearchaeota archaeon]|nr:50S ribosome-binding GTPase [Candidatus Pacearchaeota archaeon]
MALPPEIQKRQIKKRLIGLDGKTRLNEIKKILEELPGYNQGPYGEIRKSLMIEIDKTKTRSKVKHQDWLGVPRQGDRQFVLVGRPSSGKSSLLSKLSGMEIKIASYEFTTLKPIPAIIKLNGAQIQIVDLPGLIEGATEDIGGGKRLIGIVKNTDGIIFMVDLTKSIDKAESIFNELKKAKIEKPMIIVGNKIDSPESKINAEKLRKRFSENLVLISALTGEGLNSLRDKIWEESNLIRIYTGDSEEPIILEKGSTVKDLVLSIHKKLLDEFKEAVINGSSAKFPYQKVGVNHLLEDGDFLKIVTK